MSKKKFYNKHLEKGRFYIHSDGHGGHPALLYKKRDRKNDSQEPTKDSYVRIITTIKTKQMS